MTIYVAGDVQTARQTCRRFCLEGLCVTVTPTEFIYTGGAEAGVAVGLVNYPRFPSTQKRIMAIAERLARQLVADLCQTSALVVGPRKTWWLTNRPV